MKIVSGFDEKTIDFIAKNCGAKSVKSAANYIRVPFIGGAGFVCEIIDGTCFFAGTKCKKHFRLYEMAVLESEQKKGYGTAMIYRIKKICADSGLKKITLRTSKEESAINFYRKFNCKIIGEKDGDWEVEIPV